MAKALSKSQSAAAIAEKNCLTKKQAVQILESICEQGPSPVKCQACHYKEDFAARSEPTVRDHHLEVIAQRKTHGLPNGTSWGAGRNYDWGTAGFKDDK